MNQKPYVVAIGDCGIDHYYNAKRWPSLGEQYGVVPADTYVGGLVANASRTIAGYGIHTLFMGVTPDNEDGKYILDTMQKAGLDLNLHRVDPDAQTSVCLIFTVPSGERTILYLDRQKQNSRELSPDQIDAILNADFVYTTLGGMSSYTNTKEVFAKAREAGVPIACDFESFDGSAPLSELIDYIDYILINDHDFAYLPQGKSEQDTCDALIENGATMVVVTKGAQGVSVYAKDQVVHHGAYDVQVVDTTGAGDTFNSSFVSCMVWGKTIQEACDFATAAAGRAVTVLGPSGGVTSVENVLAFQNTHSLK